MFLFVKVANPCYEEKSLTPDELIQKTREHLKSTEFKHLSEIFKKEMKIFLIGKTDKVELCFFRGKNVF